MSAAAFHWPAYWALFRGRFRMLLQYRAAALAGIGTQLFWGLIRMMIFEAFYRSGSAAAPMTLPQVISYVWLGQASIALLPWAADSELRAMVRTGTVAYELLRPTDFYLAWYSRTVANRAAPYSLRSVPILLLSGLCLGLSLPASPGAALAWLVSTACALLLSSAVAMVMNVSLFWTVSAEGVSRLVPALILLASGFMIPLPLFPDWLQPVFNFLPFRGMADIPFRLYTGSIPLSEAPAVLGHQLLWTAALVLVGRGILARGTRRLELQGG